MDNNVIDIKTKGPIFNQKMREELRKCMNPEDAAAAEEKVSQVEQIICTAMVQAARNVAEKFATKVFKTLVKQTETPK